MQPVPAIGGERCTIPLPGPAEFPLKNATSLLRMCSNRLLKNPLFAVVSMDLIGLFGSLTLRPGVCGPLAARIGVLSGSGGHQVGASASSLGSRTKL